MKKNYIKMNDNVNYLSFGNVVNVIKKISNNNNAMQTEIFCSIFGVNDVNTTTINNYCIGIRAIGLEFKKKFEEQYNENNLKSNILSLVSILDNKVYSNNVNAIMIINESVKMKLVIEELITIASNDEHIENVSKFKCKDNYNSIIELLYYAIIENKQPLFTQNINIKINKDELNDYMRVKLYWGQSYISSLIELAKKNNMYACADLGSLEFDGKISGKVDYDKSFYYYLKAADKDHPKACWMVANLILSNKVKYDFDLMWKYLNKSIKLGSAAGYNTLGLCYIRGINNENKTDLEKAKYYFTIASDLGYVFAFNNLGKMYEKENLEESIKYYKISADMNDSWALNKVGEYYRKNGDMKTAYMYYTKAIESPINERCKYAYYNLAKYYFENGCKVVNINKDAEITKKYYDLFNQNNNL